MLAELLEWLPTLLIAAVGLWIVAVLCEPKQ